MQQTSQQTSSKVSPGKPSRHGLALRIPDVLVGLAAIRQAGIQAGAAKAARQLEIWAARQPGSQAARQPGSQAARQPGS